MARRESDGFPKEELAEDVGLQGGVDQNGALQVGESSLTGNFDSWDLSSSQEILDNNELLGELKDYQRLLEEGEQGFDLGEPQDFERAGDASPTNPLFEGDENPKKHSTRFSWKPEKITEEGSIGGLKKSRGIWDIDDQEDASPELFFDGQYGLDFSVSPKAPQDTLPFHKCSFASDNVDDELSESSGFNPSPCGPPPVCTHLAVETQRLDFLKDRKLSLESGRSLESSLEGSLQYSWSLLDFQSMEELQNSPSLEVETFPESSWQENLGQSLGKVSDVEASQTPQWHALSSAKTEKSLLVSGRETRIPRPQRQVGSWLDGRTRKLKADVPHGLPSKFTRQSRSLSPQQRASHKKMGQAALKEPIQESQPTPVTRDSIQYGQGKLNYPLPDLSKVEPRVKFPKDTQSYHPPQGKTSPASRKDARRLVIFKSPAEIVQEVLLSSGEGSFQKSPALKVSVIPEELKSPRQATELVHQLQEDYHKLLTKYAEAENTIDRLRLSAKVQLCSDPPKPSQGVEMGRMSEASKVITFNIPQIRAAEITGKPSRAASHGRGEGFTGHAASCDSMGLEPSGTDGSIWGKTPLLGSHHTRLLDAQASKLQSQIEFLEEMIQNGGLETIEQIKGFARLKEDQQALECAYLQARSKYKHLQNQEEPVEMLGEFDPNRAVEGSIFRLGIRLEALKEGIGQAKWNQQIAPDCPQSAVLTPPCFPEQLCEEQAGSPVPSLQTPIPAVCTPYPEVHQECLTSTPKRSCNQAQPEGNMDSFSEGSGEEGGDFLEFPQPWKHQVEKNFDHLQNQYSRFKSLPEGLNLEQLPSLRHNSSLHELDSATTMGSGTKERSPQKMSPAKTRTPTNFSTSKESQEAAAPGLPLRKVQQPTQQLRRASSIPVLYESTETNHPSDTISKMSSRSQQGHLSSHSSTESVVGSIASGPAAPDLPQKTNVTLPEDLRIVSPETDSGFVGSEASRVSPLAPMSKHQSSGLRSHRIQRPSALPSEAPSRPPSSKEVLAAMEPVGKGRPPGFVKARGRISRATLSKGQAFQKNPPSRWTNEMEPGGKKSAPTDSETEAGGTDSLNTYGPPPTPRRRSPGSSRTLLHPAQDRCNSFLDSRLERDKAIAALQNEVSQLRRSLEKTLRQPYTDLAHSSSLHSSRVQDRAPLSASATPVGRMSEQSTAESEQPFPVMEPKGKPRRLVLVQDPLQSEDAPSTSQKGRHRVSSRIKPSKQCTIQGPYTGAQYPIWTPKSEDPKTQEASALCTHCRAVQLQGSGGPISHFDPRETKGCDSPKDESRPSKHSIQKQGMEGWLCHLCKGAANSKSKGKAGVEDHQPNTPEQSSMVQPKLSHLAQPKQTGLLYWAVPSAATSLSYIPTIPLAPYPLSTVICSPLGTTSVSSGALPAYYSARQQATPEQKVWALWQHPREDHCCSRAFHCASLEDLNWTLNRAVEAAKDMNFTTQQMSRSLSWALRKARSPRASCLF